ncbi:hypothetical protein [Bradyrhizobium oligotrophicum]|nr:hypothetical protein [Bradyrhizobium oligotrophicum]
MASDMKCGSPVIAPLRAAAGLGAVVALAALCCDGTACYAQAETAIRFPTLSSQLPADIPGGAGNATITDAAVFAWQEFIALNWPAAKQTGVAGSQTRGVPDNSKRFGDDSSGANQANQPVVWETYRSKVETFPGVGDPPGYVNDPTKDYGFDVGPAYVYGTRSTTSPPNGPPLQNNPGGSPLNVPPCQNPAQSAVATPAYVNLDEITQIGLDSMLAGVLPSSIKKPTAQNANAQPQLIRFLAKGNRTFYDYVAANTFWYQGAAFVTAKSNFNTAAVNNQYPPPQPTIALPAGTVLVKAAWRQLAPSENASSFHTKTVRFYDEGAGTQTACYREQTWALIALHIIQKTPTAPNFIFATFEYTSNILNQNGTPVENNNGAEVKAPPGDAMNPRLNYFDVNNKYYSPDQPKGVPAQPPAPTPPSGATLPLVQVTGAYCKPESSLYFQDLDLNGDPVPPANSGVCVKKRYFAIPPQIQQVNAAAHAALSSYGAPPIWQNYKLVNVQWQPFDISDIDTSGKNSSRLSSTFSLANSVVETDNTLQQFFGGLFYYPNANNGLFFKSAFEIDPNTSKSTGPAFNIYGPPGGQVPPNQFTRTNMGGCMGCHGRAQRGGTDFSFTLSGGPVAQPEFAVPTTAVQATAPAARGFPVGFDKSRLEKLHAALAGR